ncbi:hypothetical protein, partial [Atlantibacter hermannii]|uniref:hypothetical protein n=1 Tax=Atlantibacter hermannii TaxID=565 RepID=UPI002898AAB7
MVDLPWSFILKRSYLSLPDFQISGVVFRATGHGSVKALQYAPCITAVNLSNEHVNDKKTPYQNLGLSDERIR